MKRYLECDVLFDNNTGVNYVFDVTKGSQLRGFINLIMDSIDDGCIEDIKVNLIYDE